MNPNQRFEAIASLRLIRNVGVVNISQFTVAGFALAQFAFAYSLIAQVGIYLHEGHGQIVKNITELLEML